MKKLLWSCLCIVGSIVLSGCGAMSYQAGHSKIGNMTSADLFTIGKTTLDEVHNELGGTSFIFDKGDGVTKYVWQSESSSLGINPTAYIPVVGAFTGASIQETSNRNTLALTFDKNNILVAKFFKSGDYQDPDISKMTAQMMNQVYKK